MLRELPQEIPHTTYVKTSSRVFSKTRALNRCHFSFSWPMYSSHLTSTLEGEKIYENETKSSLYDNIKNICKSDKWLLHGRRQK